MIPDWLWLLFALHGLEIGLMVSLGYWMLRSQRRADTQRTATAATQERQADLLEKLYNLQNKALRPQIQQQQQRAFARCLLDSGLFDMPAARRNLLLDLPGALRDSLTIGEGSALIEIQQILNRAASWSDKAFNQVLDNAAFMLDDSAGGQELARLRQEAL